MTATSRTTRTPSAPTGGPAAETEPAVSNAFRIVAWIVTLAVTATSIFGLAEIVLMWLPDDTLVSLISGGDHDALELDFRSQFFHIGIVAWAIVPSLFAMLRRPERRVAPMLQAWLGTLALLVVMASVGGLEPIDFIALAAITLLAVLFPARSQLVSGLRFDRWQVGVLAIGIVPWLVRASVAIGDARDAGDFEVGDSPVHMVEGSVAVAVVLMLLAAAIGATASPGWKLPAWTAALSSILLGVHALVFEDQAASLPAPWAVAAVAWGTAYGAATLRRSRGASAGQSDG